MAKLLGKHLSSTSVNNVSHHLEALTCHSPPRIGKGWVDLHVIVSGAELVADSAFDAKKVCGDVGFAGMFNINKDL